MLAMTRIDLHTHSTASDGTTPPAELPALAYEAGLGAIALTDHDTTAGHAACAEACAKLALGFVPGIELSCERGRPRGSMHILGYFVDGQTPELRDVIELLWAARTERAPQIVQRLNDLGVDVSLEEVNQTAGCAMIGRPHIAAVLEDKGYVGSIREAFEKYIGHGAPAYVRKDNLPTDRAIAAIHAAGGLAVLAHPIQLRCDDDDELEHIIARLTAEGLDGLEVLHSDHTPTLAEQYRLLAERHGLLSTGGSDFHGDRKPIALGSQHVPGRWLEQMRQAREAQADLNRQGANSPNAQA